MSNLTNRSKLFLKKKKAQYGDFIRDSVSYIDQDVFQQKPMYSQQKEESSLVDSLPLISSVGQIVGGIAGIFEGNKKRRIQQIFDNASQEDLKQRREQSRANNFYLTPYTVGRTDDLTAKKGMKVPVYQNGGQMDLFMDFYNQQEQASKDLLNQLKNTYKDKNERLLNDAGQTKNNAFNNILGGAMGVATSLFQGGGLLPESSQVQILPREFSIPSISGSLKSQEFKSLPDSNVNRGVPVIPNAQAAAVTVAAQTPDYLTNFQFIGKGSNKVKSKPRYRMKQEGGEINTESLYSEDFQSPNEDQGFSEQEIQNFLSSTVPGEEMQKNSNLLSWLFEEEPLDTYTTNDIYHSTYGQDTSNVSTEIPVKPLVDQFNSLGIKVGSINTGTHNLGSKHYSGKAFDIPGSKNGGKQGLYRIYNYLNSPEGKKQFPNIKIVNEIEKPAGKIGDANHLHIELLD